MKRGRKAIHTKKEYWSVKLPVESKKLIQEWCEHNNLSIGEFLADISKQYIIEEYLKKD